MEQLLLMICALGCIVLARADHKGDEHGQHPNRHFVGLLEVEEGDDFVVAHFCEERETKAIYFGSGLVDENGVEGTSFVGRDVDGAEDIGDGIFQLSGETYTIITSVGVNEGTWQLNYDSNTAVYEFSVDIPGVFVSTQFPTKVNGRAHSRHRGGHAADGGGRRRRRLSHQFVREEYRCFMPYGGPLNTDFPQAFKTVESGQNRVGELEKTNLVLYRPIEAGAGCNDVVGEPGVDTSLGYAYEGRLSFLSFDSATQPVCPSGAAFALVVAQDVQYAALSCADGAGEGVHELFELDRSDADWHSCPIGP